MSITTRQDECSSRPARTAYISGKDTGRFGTADRDDFGFMKGDIIVHMGSRLKTDQL